MRESLRVGLKQCLDARNGFRLLLQRLPEWGVGDGYGHVRSEKVTSDFGQIGIEKNWDKQFFVGRVSPALWLDMGRRHMQRGLLRLRLITELLRCRSRC